jgi:hypothetical protein
MIECPKCGAKYPTERLFCGKCREPLGIRCHVCGFINLLDDLFCGICQNDLKAEVIVSVRHEDNLADNTPVGLYQELLAGVGEDKNTGNFDNKLSQEEIDNIFLKDEES